jgi:hypothetical protein
MKLPALVFFLLLIPSWSNAQTVCTAESKQRLESILTHLSSNSFTDLSPGELNLEIGSLFLETPYVEKTLELPGEEQLVINLTGLDCTTFLETVIALSRITQKGKLSFGDYEQELEFIRYQNGTKKDYSSRIHYFTDWIFQSQEKGILTDITSQIGGMDYPNHPSFMSDNPQFYAQLAHPNFLEKIKQDEKAIQARKYHYIPKENVTKQEAFIQSGDLIAITTTIKNLDVVHVGFAVKQNGRIHLMHASSTSKKVEISQSPLSDYLKSNKSQSGILVSRLVF